MITQLFAIRGAATVAADTKEAISVAATELMDRIVRDNGLSEKCFEITSIICSTTSDITAAYPVAAIRESGFKDAPLFSCVEPDITGGLKLCIRLLVNVTSTADKKHITKHVYLGGAAKLRPDLSSK